jgi:vacuolar-type H+-ATPase subunit H
LFITQVYPEWRLWQQLSAELVRQAHLECSQRGQLLQAATQRQQELLQQALDSCDALYQAMLLSAATQLQQQECMLAAQAESNALRQDNMRLKVRTAHGIHL